MAKSKSYGGLIFLLVVIIAAAGGGWYYFRGKGEKQPEFQTTKVQRGNIIQVVTATGDLQPVVTVDIGAQVSGQIKEVLVDFNSRVKQGDVLARIDEATPTQRLKQAKADLASAEANNQLIQINAKRTKELFDKNLVSQQELDSITAQLAQSDATLLTRRAAVANAELDLERTVITAPIDGMVLDRKTDKGRTVNASMNAPVLFTLVNDLSKMQINAAVAEADVGSISEGQQVRFTVDAFPNQTFMGTVRMVRNAATAQQSVVSYATIIDVSNEDLRLKPGMTANVSIIVQQRNDVLRLENGALRVRIPNELQSKVVDLTASAAAAKGAEKGSQKSKDGKAGPTMTDDEQRAAIFAIRRDAGIERGQQPSADQIAKVKKLAAERGLDPDLTAAAMSAPMRKTGGSGGPGGGSRGSGGGSFRGGGGPSGGGFNNTIVSRDLYRLVGEPNTPGAKIEKISVRLGISDGFYTEVLEGLKEGDTMIKGVTMPGAAPVMAGPPQGGPGSNPFSGGRSFGGSSSGGMRSR